jgi:o-succinylbenzoate---CoA ligase
MPTDLPLIHLGTHTIDLKQFITGENIPLLPHYTLRALEFCKNWLSGQEEFVLHTSGSTGTPKPIRLHRRQMEASAAMTIQTLGLQKGDKALVCLNTDYIAGTMMLVRCMQAGMDMFLQEPSANPLHTWPPDTKLDFTALVPMQMQNILSETADKKPILDSMKAILLGGAPVAKSLETALQAIQAPCYHTYGMTETVSHIALRRLNGPNRTEYFTAFDEVQLGTDDRGCLTIQSVLSNGQKLITNDLANLQPGNRFVWLGRADQVINSGGIKLQAATIETNLEPLFNQLQLQANYFIAPLPHPLLGSAAVLFIEHTQPSQNLLATLKKYMPAYLQRYEIPKEIFWLSSFQQTATGKTDRLATLQPYMAHFSTT